MPKVSKTEGEAPLIRHTSEDTNIVISVYRKAEGLLMVRAESLKGTGQSTSNMLSLFQTPQEVLGAFSQDVIQFEQPLLWSLLKRDLEALF